MLDAPWCGIEGRPPRASIRTESPRGGACWGPPGVGCHLRDALLGARRGRSHLTGRLSPTRSWSPGCQPIPRLRSVEAQPWVCRVAKARAPSKSHSARPDLANRVGLRRRDRGLRGLDHRVPGVANGGRGKCVSLVGAHAPVSAGAGVADGVVRAEHFFFCSLGGVSGGVPPARLSAYQGS